MPSLLLPSISDCSNDCCTGDLLFELVLIKWIGDMVDCPNSDPNPNPVCEMIQLIIKCSQHMVFSTEENREQRCTLQGYPVLYNLFHIMPVYNF